MQVVLVLLHKRIVPYETHKIKKYGRELKILEN